MKQWFCKTVLISYLVADLCMPKVFATGTAPNLLLQNNLMQQQSTQAPPMPDGSSAFAQDFNAGSGKNRPPGLMAGQGEFISGNYPGAVLIPVTILGAVSKPGIHHIPTRTHLIKFLSLAGGINPSASLEDVRIKRVLNKDKAPLEKNGEQSYHEEIIKVDLEELLNEPGNRGPVLQQDDLVIIKETRPFFSNNTLLTIGFISSILGIVVSGIVISNELNN